MCILSLSQYIIYKYVPHNLPSVRWYAINTFYNILLNQNCVKVEQNTNAAGASI